MRTLALNLDNGNLGQWVGDPVRLLYWSEKLGDRYPLRVHLYKGSGGVVSDCDIHFFTKRPERPDGSPLWSLTAFVKQATVIPYVSTYFADVDVSGEKYEELLKVDTSSGNDNSEITLTGYLRAVSQLQTVEASFNYKLLNSGFRLTD